MALLTSFGEGLQRMRKSRGLTQEDFSEVSSRTYLSSLERGLKAPTITKLEELAAVLGIHPLSLLALAYLPAVFVNVVVASLHAACFSSSSRIRSGFSQTWLSSSQFLVPCVQRRGLRFLAA
jgi:transcriptional regulator with XRE-family HTH domain